MLKEFEGKTEQEAIDKAIDDLQLQREEFDVEILESGKKGFLFKKGPVRIRVHINDDQSAFISPVEENRGKSAAPSSNDPMPQNKTEEALIGFLAELLTKMGFPGTISVLSREEGKIRLGIESEHSNILIGRKGKNLDAIQLLVNVFAGKNNCDVRVIVDTEEYRTRREDALRRLAHKTADQVRKSKGTKLLEPMNPFERRLIHTSLNDMEDIETKSEGDGLYKQVRVIYQSH